MQRLKVFPILLFVFLLSCDRSAERHKQGKISTDAFVKKIDGHPSIATSDSFRKDRKEIVGKWQNDDDTKDMLVFSDKQYISIYEHSEDTFVYVFSRTSCDEADAKNSQSRSLYLNAKNSRNVSLCYEVTRLDSSSLALMYLSNGNVFTYHRLK